MPNKNTKTEQNELSDRILFLYSNSENIHEPYLNALESQNYHIDTYDINNVSDIPNDRIDLIILFNVDENKIPNLILELNKTFLSTRTPLVIITANEVSKLNFVEFKSCETLTFSQGVSKFLVTISIQLRIQKIQNKHVGSQVEVMSQNAVLRDLNNRFQKDLIEAREIHERIIPRELPSFNSIICATSYLPLELVGGDIFDIWKINEDCVGIFLGDITGHGLPAAFIASMTKMCLALAPKSDPAEIMTFLNKNLAKYLPDGRFITATCCIIDVTNEEISYCNAGHPPSILYQDSIKSTITMSEKGMPLNLSPDYIYQTYKIQAKKGDKILIYSDGIYETTNMDNQLMGLSRLETKFKEVSEKFGIEDAISAMSEFQIEFSAGRSFKDDVTLIGVEIKC